MPQMAWSFQWYFDGLLCGPSSESSSWTRLWREGSEGSEGSACLCQAGSKGCGLPLRAMLIKSALRDWLYGSYVMKSITSISHLRWLFPLWWLAPPKGGCIPSPAGRLYGFSRQRRHKKWRRRRRTSPVERYFIPPEGGALNPPVRRSRSQAEPWQPRAERPGGWLNPHARKGVSTFGNTGKHRETVTS